MKTDFNLIVEPPILLKTTNESTPNNFVPTTQDLDAIRINIIENNKKIDVLNDILVDEGIYFIKLLSMLIVGLEELLLTSESDSSISVSSIHKSPLHTIELKTIPLINGFSISLSRWCLSNFFLIF